MNGLVSEPRIYFRAGKSNASMDLVAVPAHYLTRLGVTEVWRVFSEVMRHNAHCFIGIYSEVSHLRSGVSGKDVVERLAVICAMEGTRSMRAEDRVDQFQVVRELESGRPSPVPGVTRVLGSTGSSFYSLYIASPAWRRVRAAALELAEHRCQRCSRGGPGWIGIHLDVHHISYERLGEERPDDVEVLCRRCHREADVERRRGGVSR